MFIISFFLEAVATVLNIVLTLYMIIVIARAIISWVSPDPYNPIVRFLYQVTEPVLWRVRKIVPFYTGGIDLSPIIVLLAIVFLQKFLVQTLLQLAYNLR